MLTHLRFTVVKMQWLTPRTSYEINLGIKLCCTVYTNKRKTVELKKSQLKSSSQRIAHKILDLQIVYTKPLTCLYQTTYCLPLTATDLTLNKFLNLFIFKMWIILIFQGCKRLTVLLYIKSLKAYLTQCNVSTI